MPQIYNYSNVIQLIKQELSQKTHEVRTVEGCNPKSHFK
jgi:hypothetical protein